MKNFLRRLFPDKEMRAYRKMYRKHRKELVKLAKESRDFDWGYLHDLVMMKIRHMYEYYVANNNVWQDDEKRLMIIEQMKEVLRLDMEIDAVYDFPDEDLDHESARELMAREDALYVKLYKFIGENLRWWWD